jgi:parallel beta-helix repeat protein
MNKNRKIYLPAAWLTAVLIILNPASLQAAMPTCGTTLTSDTTFDSDLNCTDDFVPLVISGEEGSGITLDCAGFSVRTTGEGAGAIVVDNATGVTVKNCTIITHGLFALGIALQDSSDSEISNNTITTTGSSANGINLSGSSDSDVLSNNITTFGIGSEGINMSQSNNNLVDGNTMSVTGLYARGIQLQNVSLGNTLSNNTAMADLSVGVRLRSGSDNNTLSGNTLESSTSHALDIQSASDNQMIANTMISPVSFAAVRNLSIQNGGLSVDDAGNIFAIENNFGSQGGSGGAVNTLVQIDPATGDPISFVRVVSGGADLGFGFDSLEIMSDGRFLATRGGNSNSLFQIDPISGEATQLPALTLPPLEGSLNGLQSTGPNTLLATTNEGELLSIDLDTGTVILLGDENDTPWSDLAMEPVSGRLFTTTRWSTEDSGTSHLYEINPADG